MSHPLAQASRIWYGNDDTRLDEYVRFRRKFTLAEVPEQVWLALAADTEYAVYVNGRRLPGTQFPGYPAEKYFSETEIAAWLHPGENTIAVLVHHFGRGNATHALSAAGLRAAILLPERQLLSDASWKSAPSESYRSGSGRMLSIPVGFRFEYDARRQEPWQQPDFDDTAWPDATVLPLPAADGSWQRLQPRPVPCLREKSPEESEVIWQGEFLQRANCDEGLPTEAEAAEPFLRHRLPEELFGDWREGWNCRREDSSDYPVRLRPDGVPLILQPPRPGITGISVIIDLKREMVGFPVLELECVPGDEVTLEVHHGEHLDDGRVRSRILFARYIDTIHTGGGKLRFTHPLRRIGARYLQLFFSGTIRGPIRLTYAGLSETVLPLPPVSDFASDSELLATLRRISADTLTACMHDHYEDCPWREQSLYAYDSRNQILYGYYLWGNYDFAAASLDLLGARYFDDIGYLSLCAPSDDRLTIPVFTYAWIVEVMELVLFSGKVGFFERHRALIDDILTQALARPDRRHPGLYSPGAPERIWNIGDDPGDGQRVIWNFYEWCYELANAHSEPQALYQCYFIEALQAASRLHAWSGNPEQAAHYAVCAAAAARAVDAFFWDEVRGCYRQFHAGTEQKYYEHVQAMMLTLEIPGTPERRRRTLAALQSEALEPCTFSSLLYWVKAMMAGTPETRALVGRRLRANFAPMLRQNATTVWELPNGGNTGRFGGSLCHGWSAIPAYYANCCMLGIRPTTPGFREFSVAPYWENTFRLSGSVPTPYGPIQLTGNAAGANREIRISAPSQLKYTITSYPEYEDWQ